MRCEAVSAEREEERKKKKPGFKAYLRNRDKHEAIHVQATTRRKKKRDTLKRK